MAAQNPLRPQKKAPPHPVLFNRLGGVSRTGRRKAADGAAPGRNRFLVERNHTQDNGFHRLLLSNNSRFLQGSSDRLTNIRGARLHPGPPQPKSGGKTRPNLIQEFSHLILKDSPYPIAPHGPLI